MLFKLLIKLTARFITIFSGMCLVCDIFDSNLLFSKPFSNLEFPSHVLVIKSEITFSLLFYRTKHFLSHTSLTAAINEITTTVESSSSMMNEASEKADFNNWLDTYVKTEFDSKIYAIEYWLKQADKVPAVAAVAFKYLTVPACNKSCYDTVATSAAFNSLRHFSDRTEALDNLFFLHLNFSSCPQLQNYIF